MVPSWVLVLLCNLIAGGGVVTCILRGARQMHRGGRPNGTSGGPLPTGIRIGRQPSFRQVVQSDQRRRPVRRGLRPVSADDGILVIEWGCSRGCTSCNTSLWP